MDIFNNVMKLLPAKKQPKTLLRIMCQNLHDVKCLQKCHDARFPSIILFCLIKSYLMTTNLHFYAGLLQNGGPGCGKAPDSASPAAAWLTGRHHQAGPPQTHAESCICKHLYLKTYEVATTFICQKYFFATAERVWWFKPDYLRWCKAWSLCGVGRHPDQGAGGRAGVARKTIIENATTSRRRVIFLSKLLFPSRFPAKKNHFPFLLCALGYVTNGRQFGGQKNTMTPSCATKYDGK